MRGLVQYFIFSGIAWFAAATGVLVAAAIDALAWKRATSPGRILLFVSVAIGALSGTPVPWWLAIPLVATIGGYTLVGFGRRKAGLITAVVILTIAAAAYEARFFFVRPIGRMPGRVVVLGDSLSSGGFGEQTIWPDRLGIDVHNLSQPSETVSSALEYQVPRVAEFSAEVILVELGGNDMLDGTPPRTFGRDLDTLLERVAGPRVIMFEFPLLPGKWAYGAHQRRLAREHRVLLIPKRVLARVLTDPANVAGDALHLSERGHARMAEEVLYWIGRRDAPEVRPSTAQKVTEIRE